MDRTGLVPALLCAFVVLHLPNCAVEGSMQDLTHYYDDHVIRWPGHKPWVYNLNRKPFVTITNKTLWLESNDFATAEHMGTHIDAPAHLYKGAKRLDEIPLEDLIAPMVVIDVRAQAKQERDYAVTIQDILNYEKEHGQIPEGAAVFMRAGWDQFWFEHDRARYLGTLGQDIWELHHPGFDPDTAEWLINNRNIKGMGSDSISFDIGSAHEFGVHTTLFSHNVWGLENLCNLDKTPPRGATVHVMPMNIWQASGAPSRVVAFWGDGQVGHLHSAAACTRWSMLTLLLTATLVALKS